MLIIVAADRRRGAFRSTRLADAQRRASALTFATVALRIFAVLSASNRPSWRVRGRA